MVLRCFLHCGGPVNFQMSSANILEVVKFQVCLLCSCIFERIKPNRGVGCGFRWLVPFHTEETLFSVFCTKFLCILSLVLFRSNAVRCI
jgi:hypothetical protein